MRYYLEAWPTEKPQTRVMISFAMIDICELEDQRFYGLRRDRTATLDLLEPGSY